jgi:DNA-binding ferritin-like protein (Dps family)
MSISKLTSKVVGDKRRYREYEARTARLPASYRTAVDALERYLTWFGPGKADSVQWREPEI